MILPAAMMDSLYEGNPKPQNFIDSVGASLAFGVLEMADVLHTFYLNVVSEDDSE